jgi:hypothetical protein
MGVTICQDHGRSSIAHVCVHVREAVERAEALPKIAEYPLETDAASPPLAVLHFCQACVRLRGLPYPPRTLSGSEQEVLGDGLNTEAVCDRCFARAVEVAG